MLINTAWIQANFARFNNKYFGGELIPPRFSVTNARTHLGSMTFKWKAERTGLGFGEVKQVDYDHCIHLSIYYDLTEHEYQNTLLHEMIHYYLSVKGLHDDNKHGTLFHQWMDRLNQDGWDISVRETNKLPVAKHNEDQFRIVLALTTTKAEYYLCVIHPRYARRLDIRARRDQYIHSHAWYITQDNYFLDYPQSRSLRGRQVSSEIFFQKTGEMEPWKPLL